MKTSNTGTTPVDNCLHPKWDKRGYYEGTCAACGADYKAVRDALGASEGGENWGANPFRAPELEEGDTLILNAPGRILYRTADKKPGRGTDYRSHYFRLVLDKWQHAVVVVRHGGGVERLSLTNYLGKQYAEILSKLDPDSLYLMLHEFHNVKQEAKRQAEGLFKAEWATAAAEGRLKTRKARGSNRVNVWIEERKPETPKMCYSLGRR